MSRQAIHIADNKKPRKRSWAFAVVCLGYLLLLFFLGLGIVDVEVGIGIDVLDILQ